jgi:hypothetical protein
MVREKIAVANHVELDEKLWGFSLRHSVGPPPFDQQYHRTLALLKVEDGC